MANRSGFGAIPLRRIGAEEAGRLFRKPAITASTSLIPPGARMKRAPDRELRKTAKAPEAFRGKGE
jgi:hypothetical protein